MQIKQVTDASAVRRTNVQFVLPIPSESQLYLTLLIIVLALTYVPLVWITYGFTDDYTVLDFTGRGAYLWGIIGYGRPLMGALEWLLFGAAGSIENLALIRAVSIFSLVIAALCIFSVFKLSGYTSRTAASVTGIMFLMPPFQVYASWAVCVYAGPAIILAYLSFQLTWLARSSLGHWIRCLRLLGAVAALTASSAFYQPLAMTYWPFLALMISGQRLDKKAILKFIIVGLAGMGSGAALLPLGQKFFPVVGERSRLVSDVLAKLVWFLTEPLRRSAGMNAINCPLPTSSFIFLAIMSGLALYCWKIDRGGAKLFALFALLLPLSLAPSLVTAESWASSRTLGALTMLLVLYAFIAIRAVISVGTRSNRFLRSGAYLDVALAVWLSTSSLFASYNVITYFALPQAKELTFVHSAIALAHFTPKSRIVFIRSGWWDSTARGAFYDEFGIPSTCMAWVPPSLLNLLLGSTRLGTTVFLGPNDPYFPAKNDVLIDMRKLSQLK